MVEAERRCRHELQAMRERHRARFMEATAKLRSQYKNLAKRARALESQLTRNSVSTCIYMYIIYVCFMVNHFKNLPNVQVTQHNQPEELAPSGGP